MGKKENFINTLCGVIGNENIQESHRQKALEFIEPNPKKYLDATRITKSEGVIDIVNKEFVSGWVKYIHDLNKSAEIELFVNDEIKIKTIANQFRQDLKEKKLHNTGNCGFKIDVQKLHLSSGDKVSIKVTDDVEYLKNSNWVIK